MKSTPITSLSGIGQKRAGAFAKLGITDTASLLRHYPRGYQHRGDVRPLSDGADGETHAFILTVGTEPRNITLRGRITLTRFSAFDGSGKCTVTYFNQTYMKDRFTVGAEFRFWGKLMRGKSGLELSSPIADELSEGVILADFVPVYPLTAGLTQKMISSAIGETLRRPLPFDETLTDEARQRLGLVTLGEALRSIHTPDDYESLDRARRRLAFDELYVFALGMAKARCSRVRYHAPSLSCGNEGLTPFLAALPFELTGAQKRAVADIQRDLRGDSSRGRMMRMLSGDVGSGKTAVAAAAVYICVRSGYQAAMMAPTEILASQHFSDLSVLLGSLGVSCALLTGSTPAAEKKRIKAALADGSLDFIIGTHALITPDVTFARAGLVICDEQHRFGIMQRTALSGENVHMLVMSATPIPRSLALILCGDLDISRLDELPPGRQKVDTFLVNESYRERLYAFIRKQTGFGRQVYIVCPSIEANNSSDSINLTGDDDPISDGIVGLDWTPDEPEEPKLKNAAETAKLLSETIFPELSVAFMHGKMRGADKDAVMRRFAGGNIDILVSTTVIEVGVNVPNSSLIIIENAERFGLSQLHQLRGRVGRGEYKSYCILVSDTKNPDSKRRLETLCTTNDGYKIAEFDLEQRGPGDFLPSDNGGTRQHGELRFKLAGINNDIKLLEDAFTEAETILLRDPQLLLPENRAALALSTYQAESMGITFN